MILNNMSQQALENFASALAQKLKCGDLIFFLGDLGVGKSTFIRALIRSRANDPDLTVPSPTFTLVQPYTDLDLPLYHLDLYRIKNPDELAELGVDEMLGHGSVLVEWPQLMQQIDYQPDLVIEIKDASDLTRQIILAGKAKFLHH